MKGPTNDLKNKDEFYGPIDGVLPQDHMETYKDILNSYCLRAISHQDKIFIEETRPRRRLCEDCYIALGLPQQFKFNDAQHSIYMCNRYIRQYALHCIHCKKQLMILRLMAFQCKDCIEEYLNNQETLLLQGEIFVYKRW